MMVRRHVVLAVIAVGCGRSHFDVKSDAGVGDGGEPAANVAFVTSTTQLPTTFGADLSGADAVCAARAQAAGLPGAFVALLSSATVNARDRLAGSRGWVRTDGKPLFDLPDDIAAGTMYYPVALDENGVDVGGADVLTGSLDNGDSQGGPCGNYSDPSSSLYYGFSDSTTGDWLSATDEGCTNTGRIYCFGTGRVVPIAIQPASGRAAFVTVAHFIPDAGGLATADALCTSEASAAALSGTFRALLATSTASAISRFSTAGPNWVRLDGIPLAASPLAFENGSLAAPLNVTSANSYLGHTDAMAGAIALLDVTGDPASACGDWTNPSGTGLAGRTSSTGAMFNDGGYNAPCSTLPIYCLEQ